MDKSFKKLLLVNPDSASMYKPTVVEKKLSALDQDISDILHSSMADDEKAKRYVSTLKTHKFLSAPKLKPVDAEAEILQSVDPPEEKMRAKELLSMIKPYLTWNDDGEIVVNDKVVPLSNIGNLLSNLMTSTVKKPEGWEAMADALSAVKIPRKLIRNPKRWSDLLKRQTSPSSISSKGKKKPRQVFEKETTPPSSSSPISITQRKKARREIPWIDEKATNL